MGTHVSDTVVLVRMVVSISLVNVGVIISVTGVVAIKGTFGNVLPDDSILVSVANYSEKMVRIDIVVVVVSTSIFTLVAV